MLNILKRKDELKDFFLSAIGLKEEDEEFYLKKGDLERLSSRTQFSKYLMPVYYDEEMGVYVNQDGTIGLMYECIPVLFFNPQSVKSFSSLFNLNYPKGTVIQIMLFSDPYIEHYLFHYVNYKKGAPDYLRKGFHNLSDFYRNLKDHLGFPARHYRVFVMIKMPIDKNFREEVLKEVKVSVYELLKSVRLYPEEVKPEDYLFLMRFLLNNVDFRLREETDTEFQEIFRKTEVLRTWIRSKTLNKQVIFADTEIVAKGDCIKFGEKRFRCLTWKIMPEEIDFIFGNLISGHYDLIDGVSGDLKQVSLPFFIVLNVFCDSINTELQIKANLMLQQQPLGTYFVTLKEKVSEYLWAVQKMNSGEKFMRGFLTFWVYGNNDEEVRTSVHKYVRILESIGGQVQEEKIVTVPLFVYSLPFGAVGEKKNFHLLDRDFVFISEMLACCAPVQADFLGTGEPMLLFLGRKGQIVGIDLFSQKSANYNFFIAAPTGKGKSFFVNYIVANYYGAGAKVRIIDIGGSYKKLVNMFRGRYLEFSPESNISLNPFALIYDPEFDIPIVVRTIVSMVSAVTGELPEQISEETAYSIIHSAVLEVLRWAESSGISYRELTIDHVYEVLSNFMKYFPDADRICGKEHCAVDFEKIAGHIAFNLYKFTSAGSYGKWFIGGEVFDISKDDFVVLELEHLKQFPDLFKVITLLVLNAVTADLYLSDRKRPTLIVLDEAWQFLQDSPAFEKVIEEGYRRARKYRGSFGIITQDILDFDGFGRVGRVILSNSAFKFMLEGVKVELAKARNIVDFDEFVIHLIKSVRYNTPKYSEIFVLTDNFGSGVVRLIVDPYSYFIYTSNPAEVAEIEELAKRVGYERAIEEMVRRKKGEKEPII
jgi:conjugal transfer ATP-binding protein TraC